MGVDPDILKDFDSSSTVFNIQEMNNNSQAQVELNDQASQNYNFNPIDKIIEQAPKIEDQYKDLLQSERLSFTYKSSHPIIHSSTR